MAYNDLIERSTPGGGALVPPEHANEIFKAAEMQSAALRFFRRIPIRTSSKTIPVLSALPNAYWIGDATAQQDTGLLQTTELAWKNTTMEVANLGVIVPIPRRLLADIRDGAGINLTEEVRPSVASAIARKIDSAIFFGVDAPTVWPDDIVTQATAAGNAVTVSATAAEGGLQSDVIQLISTVRQDGFNVNAGIARGGYEYTLLDNRDTTGQPLIAIDNLTPPTGENVIGTLMSRPVMFGDGVFPPATTDSDVEMIMFDSTKHIIGLRQDLEFTLHTDGVIQDNTGAIIYNLMQQQIVALVFTMRVGYAVANPVTVAQATEADRYPAGVLLSDPETP